MIFFRGRHLIIQIEQRLLLVISRDCFPHFRIWWVHKKIHYIYSFRYFSRSKFNKIPNTITAPHQYKTNSCSNNLPIPTLSRLNNSNLGTPSYSQTLWSNFAYRKSIFTFPPQIPLFFWLFQLFLTIKDL